MNNETQHALLEQPLSHLLPQAIRKTQYLLDILNSAEDTPAVLESRRFYQARLEYMQRALQRQQTQ
jgi:hypothetical protein